LAGSEDERFYEYHLNRLQTQDYHLRVKLGRVSR
jgi:hypothetical protein